MPPQPPERPPAGTAPDAAPEPVTQPKPTVSLRVEIPDEPEVIEEVAKLVANLGGTVHPVSAEEQRQPAELPPERQEAYNRMGARALRPPLPTEAPPRR